MWQNSQIRQAKSPHCRRRKHLSSRPMWKAGCCANWVLTRVTFFLGVISLKFPEAPTVKSACGFFVSILSLVNLARISWFVAQPPPSRNFFVRGNICICLYSGWVMCIRKDKLSYLGQEVIWKVIDFFFLHQLFLFPDWVVATLWGDSTCGSGGTWEWENAIAGCPWGKKWEQWLFKLDLGNERG